MPGCHGLSEARLPADYAQASFTRHCRRMAPISPCSVCLFLVARIMDPRSSRKPPRVVRATPGSAACHGDRTRPVAVCNAERWMAAGALLARACWNAGRLQPCSGWSAMTWASARDIACGRAARFMAAHDLAAANPDSLSRGQLFSTAGPGRTPSGYRSRIIRVRPGAFGGRRDRAAAPPGRGLTDRCDDRRLAPH